MYIKRNCSNKSDGFFMVYTKIPSLLASFNLSGSFEVSSFLFFSSQTASDLIVVFWTV